MATPNSSYWQRRSKLLEESLLKQGEAEKRVIERIFQDTSLSIQKDIESWYGRFASNNGISMAEARKWLNGKELEEFRWNVQMYMERGEANVLSGEWMQQLENASAKLHITRLESLQLQIQQQIEVLYGNHLDGLDNALRGIYSAGYYHTAFEIQKGFEVGWDLQALDKRRLDLVLSKPWTLDGTTFSDDIWKAKQRLLSTAHTELSQCIIRGDVPAVPIQAIAKRMNVAKNTAGRLVMTETAAFASISQKDCFEDLAVEEFEVVATLEVGTTCELCQAMDGQHFPVSELQPGVNAPPFHPWCRCCICPYFKDLQGERFARETNGDGYYIPADMTYKEWEKTFVVDRDLAEQMVQQQKLLHDFPFKTYQNIWKEGVTEKDYSAKKNSIEAKLKYFENKYIHAPTMEEMQKWKDQIDLLKEFESRGKEYEAIELEYRKMVKELEQKYHQATGIDDLFSQARKDAAYWFTNKKEADAVLRGPTGEVWKKMTKEQRKAAYDYTCGSGGFNRPLRGFEGSWYNYKGVGNVSLDCEGRGAAIGHLTEAISSSTYDFDLWLQRGIDSTKGVEAFLGIDSSLLNGPIQELQDVLLGKVVKDEAFLSTAACKGMGFSGPATLNIYAPKGTQMLYAEPFSQYGYGAGVKWDGDSGQDTFGYEFEIILQRGYSYRITKVEKTSSRLYLDLEILPK